MHGLIVYKALTWYNLAADTAMKRIPGLEDLCEKDAWFNHFSRLAEFAYMYMYMYMYIVFSFLKNQSSWHI